MRNGRRQLALALRERPTWGGRRARVGRPPKSEKAGIRHGSRDRFRMLPVHVTLRVRPGLPSLRSVSIVQEVERTFAHDCARRDFRLVQYSLQGNHAHLIVEADDRTALGRGMMAIGSRLARAVNRVARRHGSVLTDRYHVRLLRTPREVHRTLRYVLLNARRHAVRAGASVRQAAAPLLDPASSARWFDGWRRRCASTAAEAPDLEAERAPVAHGRHWLLRIGWRRHGLIDPGDVPGRAEFRRKRARE